MQSDPHDQRFKLGLLACLDRALAAARLERDRCRRRLLAGATDELAAELGDAERRVRYRAMLVDLVSVTILEADAAECIRRMPALVSDAHRAIE